MADENGDAGSTGAAGDGAGATGDTLLGGTGTSGVDGDNGNQGGQGVDGGNWLDSMPEEIKTNPSMEKFAGDSPEILAKSYINLEKMVGRDKIPMPTTPEEFTSAFRRLGAPETSDGYDFKAPDELPPGINYDEEGEKKFKEMAHGLNLTKEQAAGLYKQMWDVNITNFNAAQESRNMSQEQAMTALKHEWGENDFAINLEVASRGLEAVFSEESQALIKERLGDAPEIIKDLNKLGMNLIEEGALTGVNTGGAMTGKMMDDKITDLMAHPAYMDSAHIEHKKIVDQVYMLRQRKFK